MSSSTNTVKKSLELESKTESLTKHQYSGISEHSLVRGTPEHIREWLMLSLEASRVSHSVTQEKEQVKTIAEICGEKPSRSYVKYNPDSHSWRMSQGCFPSMMDDISDEYLETWARAGMMYGGECYRLPKWELRIREIGSGFWLTPSVVQIAPNEERREKRQDMRASTGRQDSPGCLLEQVMSPKFWATPTQHGNYNKKGLSKKSGDGLATQVKMYPTPTVSDAKGASGPDGLIRKDGKSRMDKLPNVVKYGGSKTQQTQTGQLNPNWVEWLMGWVIGWTDLKLLGTDKYQQWLQKHGGC